MPIATKNNAIILKDGKVAENCDCCGGWYCYCPAPDRLSMTISDYFSDAYVFTTTQVNGQYVLTSNNCLGTWTYSFSKPPFCDANSGVSNGIGISLSESFGLRVSAGDSTGSGWCIGWNTSNNIGSIASGKPVYAAACQGDFPISGTALLKNGDVTLYSFSWSIAEA